MFVEFLGFSGESSSVLVDLASMLMGLVSMFNRIFPLLGIPAAVCWSQFSICGHAAPPFLAPFVVALLPWLEKCVGFKNSLHSTMMMMKTSSPKISAKTVRVSTYWVFLRLVLVMVVYSL